MSAGTFLGYGGAAAGAPVGATRIARVHGMLAALLAANLIAMPAAFAVENLLAPWQARMDITTPGWCFMMSQAAVVGFVAALVVRGSILSVAEGLLAATLLGYAYVLANFWLIEAHRVLQYTHLVYRGVELGMVALAALLLGVVTRQILRQRLCTYSERPARTVRQYALGDLLFLMAVYGVGLAMVNLFFNHFQREIQIQEVSLSAIRTLPAALPWLWGVTQRRLSVTALAAIVLITFSVAGLKGVIMYTVNGDELGQIFEQAGRRTVAYAAGGTFNGLLLRGLGFYWQRG